MIANFFWDNKKISIYEYACLKSFLKNNFDVHVYSYKNIILPKKNCPLIIIFPIKTVTDKIINTYHIIKLLIKNKET